MKPNKCRNKKVTIDGIVFDSLKEANRWKELTLLERAGQIQNLKRQVEYLLIPAQFGMVIDKNGKHKRVCLERAVNYVADFTYNIGEEFIVEDVKGYRNPSSAVYAKFIIKRKLMLHLYGIRIRET